MNKEISSLHISSRIGDIKQISLAYRNNPTKINELDEGVIFI